MIANNPEITIGLCGVGSLLIIALAAWWVTRGNKPVFTEIQTKFAPWERARTDEIKMLIQSPTLTRAEVWINGQGYLFEDESFMTAEEIAIRSRKFAKEMEK